MPPNRAAPAIPDGAYRASGQPPSRHRLIVPSAYAPASRTAPMPIPASSSGIGLRERIEPERRHDAGRAEELAVAEAERRGGHAGAGHERPRGPVPARPPRPAPAQRRGRRDQQQAVGDVAEHHPEHQHVTAPGQPGGVDVGVRDGAVGRDERAERALAGRPGHQGRRVGAPGPRQRDGGAADAGQPPARSPTWSAGTQPASAAAAVPANRGRRELAQLSLAGDQVVPAGPRQRVEIGRRGGQCGLRDLGRAGPPLRRSPARPPRVRPRRRRSPRPPRPRRRPASAASSRPGQPARCASS